MWATHTRDNRWMFHATEEEASECNAGFCVRCGNCHESGIEPDACKYVCNSCGHESVYGLEELAVMGRLEIEEMEDAE